MGAKKDDRFKDLKIESVFDLIFYVSELNAEIRERNKTLPKEQREKELNLSYILKRYEKLKRKEEINEFREKHDCKFCFYFEKPRRCMAVDRCPLEDGGQFEIVEKFDENRKYITCPKYDPYEPCPYGNEVGNCFGFCARDIVKEMKQRKEGESNEWREHDTVQLQAESQES